MDNMSNEIYFTPYKVSTITCNAYLGKEISINLSLLYEKINPKDEDGEIIWIQNLKDNMEFVKGIYPKKIRKSKKINKKKNRFDNQITIIYRFNNEYKPNIKIFKNGNIQLTGIKNLDTDPKIIGCKIIDIIKETYNEKKEINMSKEENDDFINKLEFNTFKVRMINTDFKTYYNKDCKEKFNIRRKELHNLLISEKYNNKCTFQPGIYQGAKLEYYCNEYDDGICRCNNHIYNKKIDNNNCKKVTVAIFESGSILITGGISYDQVDRAYNFITNIIKNNIKILNKPKINIQDYN